MSDSLRPHGSYPTRLLCPWDPPAKNTATQYMGWHALLQDLPHSGSEPTFLMSPALLGGFFTSSATWEAVCTDLYKGWGGVTTFTSPSRVGEYSWAFECFADFRFPGLTLCSLDIKSSILLYLKLSAFPPFSSLPLSPSSKAAFRDSKSFPPHWGRHGPTHLAWTWVNAHHEHRGIQGLTQTENQVPLRQ